MSYYLISLFLREVKSYLQQKEEESGQANEAVQDLRNLCSKVSLFQIVVVFFSHQE